MISEPFDIEMPVSDFLKQKPDFGYVYFLFIGDNVLYIGETRKPQTRMRQHFEDKVFDTVKMIEVPADRLKIKEKELIAKYDPIFNRPSKGLKNTRIGDVIIVGGRWKKCYRVSGSDILSGNGKKFGRVVDGYAFITQWEERNGEYYWAGEFNNSTRSLRYISYNLETNESFDDEIEIPFGYHYKAEGDRYVVYEVGVPFMDRISNLMEVAKKREYKPEWTIYQVAKQIRVVSMDKIDECCQVYDLDRYFVESILRKSGVRVA